MKRHLLLLILIFGFLGTVNAQETAHIEPNTSAEVVEEEYDLIGTIMHHIQDAHEWHLWGEGANSVSLYLPVILIDNGLQIFNSKNFYYGDGIVRHNGNTYAMYHEHIYKTDANGTIVKDAEGNVTNEAPLDFSITKHVLNLFLGALILMVVFISVARSYKNDMVPRGLAKFMEPLVLFVRDDIAIPNIGERKYKKYMPYLLTMFFLIWTLNLLGLLPGAANTSGDIAFTMVLALIALIVVNVSGNSTYWSHIFDPLKGQMPWYGKMLIYPILVPVEILGIFTKPIALMIRLFANITAGHIIILSFISLIFILKTLAVAPASIILTLFINMLELLVAALQAYIFTLLTALFIGMAVQEHHHEEAH